MPLLSSARRLRAASVLALLALAAACGGDSRGGGDPVIPEPPDAPDTPEPANRPVALAAGHSYTCALTASGTAYCWGTNRFGQLGDGTANNRSTPLAVVAPERFTAISASGWQTCAVGVSGSLYCWGMASHVGDPAGGGFPGGVHTPSRVASDVPFAEVSAGSGDLFSEPTHSCALSRERRAYCWGPNGSGELGNSVYPSARIPVGVSTNVAFASIRAGALYSCGLAESGTAYCWGATESGILGDVTRDREFAPVPVAGGRAFTSLDTGAAYACGVSEGDVYCWGMNYRGELGRAPTPGQNRFPVPQAVAGLPDVRQVFTTRQMHTPSHTCALTEPGEAYCWGANSDGQVGVARDGPPSMSCGIGFICVPTPVRAAAGLRFRTLALGGTHTCGITREHEIYCWGYGTFGQLGPTNFAGGPTPVRVDLPES